MAIEQRIVEAVRGLPPEKQQEVLDFARLLEARDDGQNPPAPRIEVEGLWAGQVPDDFDLDQALKEIREQYQEDLEDLGPRRGG